MSGAGRCDHPCRNRKAGYQSGNNSTSLVFRCQVLNGPYTSLYIPANAVQDPTNTIKVSGTITEYSYDFTDAFADLRHGAVVKQATSSQVAAPTITGSPALSEAGSDGAWAAGATVEATLTFSEAVTVDTTGGTPSIGLDLGATESRRAPYLRGSGTTALVFGYTLTATDGSHTSMLVPIDSLALNGGTIRSQATSADAALQHAGAAQSGSGGGGLGTRSEGDPFTARFEGFPNSHDGSSAFTGELHFSEAPEGLSYTTVDRRAPGGDRCDR